MASLYVPPFASLHNSSWHSKESLREAKGNLRLQPLDGRTKPANGDLSTLRGTFQHAAIVCAARCECNRSGAALMMRQKKGRSVTERFVAACLWAAQPDEASPVTERLLM